MRSTVRFYVCAVPAILAWSFGEAAAAARRTFPRRRRRLVAQRVAAVFLIALLAVAATHVAPIVHELARRGAGILSTAPLPHAPAAFPVPVPEPASLVLFAEAMFALIHIQRVRRRRRLAHAKGRTR